MNTTENHNNMRSGILAAAWCAIIAFFLLMICSRSSFLYPCNDWNDANSYFTMGKAMMNGQIIYRDLYDQKGPYLYLVYGIAYLLSHTSFAGVFVMEILSVSASLFAAYKLLCLYCDRRIALMLIPVLGGVMLVSRSFYWGGAAEEFCLPLLSFSLYFSVRYFKERYPMPPCMKLLLINGIFAGIIMQVKYTMLGFYFAFMAMIALSCLFRRDFKNFFKGCFIFLGGMLITLLPWLLYFGAHNALDDWYQCYIYNNVFMYSNFREEGNGLFNRIYTLAKLLYWLILDNLSYFVFIIAGMLYFLIMPRVRWFEKINLLLLFGFLFLGIYVGGSTLPYYAIPLMIFTPLGFVAAGKLLMLFPQLPDRGLPILSALILFASAAGCYVGSANSYFMKQDRESYFLYQFKAIVEQEEEPTLLNISCLDAGLYTVADIMPTCRFFQTNGISFDEMFQEQERYVAEGLTQFVLARDTYPSVIENHYELVSQLPYEWDGMEFTYYLFRRKS